MLIDKTEIECRFKRSVESYDENAYAQKAIIRRLITLLQKHCPSVSGKILEVGCGTGLLTTEIRPLYADNELYINDLVAAMCSKATNRCQLSSEYCITGDIEQIELKGKYGLIVSASVFQWLANPARTFERLYSHLTEGGWLVFSTFGKDNYKELKTITGNGLVYHSISEMLAILSACFEIEYTEESLYVLNFDDPLKILEHVKKTGVNALRQEPKWTRGKLTAFAREYTDRFMTGGHYPLTYHPQYFICRKAERC